jgi:CheY-like chemotaxis protein
MSQRVIYVVEDDYLHREWIVKVLRQNFADQLEVKEIKTHSGFEANFEAIAADQPVAVILDVMLQWKDTEVAKDPAKLDSYLRAGLECASMLAKDPRTRNAQVILYTVLERANMRDIPKGAVYLSKGSRDRDLVACVKTALAARG